MSSTLKVDILQDSGGNNLVTSNGSGVITAAGFGKVGQVVQGTTTTEVSTTGESYIDTNLSVSITPSSTSSKILITVCQSVNLNRNSNAVGMGLRLVRGSTEIYGGDQPYENYYNAGGAGDTDIYVKIPMIYLDSPATTSATTYKTQFRRFNAGTVECQTDSIESTIQAMEILP